MSQGGGGGCSEIVFYQDSADQSQAYNSYGGLVDCHSEKLGRYTKIVHRFNG